MLCKQHRGIVPTGNFESSICIIKKQGGSQLLSVTKQANNRVENFTENIGYNLHICYTIPQQFLSHIFEFLVQRARMLKNVFFFSNSEAGVFITWNSFIRMNEYCAFSCCSQNRRGEFFLDIKIVLVVNFLPQLSKSKIVKKW